MSKINPSLSSMAAVKRALEKNDSSLAVREIRRGLAHRLAPSLKGREELLSLIKTSCKKEVEETLKVAKEVSQKEFLFRYPWDMEKSVIPHRFSGEIEWDAVPFGDPEWCYMLNRHRYWISLGQAYELTGDESFVLVFMDQISHWIENNPLSEELKTSSWRTIEAGIRCENWIRALCFFISSPSFSDEVFAEILLSLNAHAVILAEHFSNFSLTSNWGIIENHGLYILSHILDIFKEAPYWQKTAEERLLKCLSLQIYSDGMHWEQSATYHCEVLKCLLAVMEADRRTGCSTHETIRASAELMAGALLKMVKPNGCQPLLGDSDEVNVRELFTEAALLLKIPEFKFLGERVLGFEALFRYGLKGFYDYNDLPLKTPSFTSAALDYSHNYIMRSGWGKESFYLLFDCGSLGGGHGHGDLMHFDLSAWGRDFLVDAGRYTYCSDNSLRKKLKSPSSHNTLLIDGKDFCEYKDTWQWENPARAMGQVWRSCEEFDYVEATHQGYRDLEDPLLHTRKILFVKNSYWILFDIVHCRDEHLCEQFFHFKGNRVKIDARTQGAVTHWEEGANLALIPLNREGGAVISSEERSPEYNSLEEGTCYTRFTRLKGSTSLIHLLYPVEEGIPQCEFTPVKVHDRFGRSVSGKYAEAVKVLLPDNEEHVILIVHRSLDTGIDAFIVDGTFVFGEIVLIKRKDNHEEILSVK